MRFMCSKRRVRFPSCSRGCEHWLCFVRKSTFKDKYMAGLGNLQRFGLWPLCAVDAQTWLCSAQVNLSWIFHAQLSANCNLFMEKAHRGNFLANLCRFSRRISGVTSESPLIPWREMFIIVRERKVSVVRILNALSLRSKAGYSRNIKLLWSSFKTK